jgi:anti-anti-sigma factor
VLEVAPLEDTVGVALRGTLDLATEEEANGAVAPLLHPGASVTLDLRDLEFMDSTGLGVVARVLTEVGQDGRMTVRFSAGIVARVLEVSGILERPNVIVERV